MLFIAVLTILAGCNTNRQIEWISPYKDIDWDNVIQAKAQFHAHTTVSDGWLAPHAVVETYKKLGYQVLALTDHWHVTYPWTEFSDLEPSGGTYRRLEAGEMEGYSTDDILVFEDRDPDLLGMVAIPGAEPSHTGAGEHHLVSLFSGVTGSGLGFRETLDAIEEARGLVSFAHPGRDTEWNNNTVEDYIYYFDRYEQLYGLDIFTSYTITRQNERWERCFSLVSDLLNHYGLYGTDNWRPVWLTSTDDMHRPNEYHSGFQIQLLNKFDKENVYKSLKDGAFFWVAQAHGEEPPLISSVQFDGSRIIVSGEGYDRIAWYSGNKVIHEGDVFDLLRNGYDDLFYLFFVAHTSDFSLEYQTGSLIGSQPIWVVRQ